jgi:hypothetical protein
MDSPGSFYSPDTLHFGINDDCIGQKFSRYFNCLWTIGCCTYNFNPASLLEQCP